MANLSKKRTIDNKSEKEMLKGVIDDGTKEIPIVNKFGHLICNIYIRPADFSIIDRYDKLKTTIGGIIKPLEKLNIKRDGTSDVDSDWEIIKSVETNLKHAFNELFDMDEADAIFEKRNAFSSVGGEFFCLKVLNVLGDVITQAINEEAELSKKRVEKFLVNQNAGRITNNTKG